jgi:hypothetical protein
LFQRVTVAIFTHRQSRNRTIDYAVGARPNEIVAHLKLANLKFGQVRRARSVDMIQMSIITLTKQSDAHHNPAALQGAGAPNALSEQSREQVQVEIVRLLSDLIRIGLADVDRPPTAEYQILATEVATALLSDSSPSSQR